MQGRIRHFHHPLRVILKLKVWAAFHLFPTPLCNVVSSQHFPLRPHLTKIDVPFTNLTDVVAGLLEHAPDIEQILVHAAIGLWLNHARIRHAVLFHNDRGMIRAGGILSGHKGKSSGRTLRHSIGRVKLGAFGSQLIDVWCFHQFVAIACGSVPTKVIN